MKLQEKEKAIALRRKGYSYNEILQEITVSKSTLSLWLSDLVLTLSAQKRLDDQFTNGQLKARESILNKTKIKEGVAHQNAMKTLSRISFTKEMKKLFCGILYWCEGSKSRSNSVGFTNSDPDMIKTFLQFFRDGFDIDERKFRVCVHLHSYHKKDTVLQYWSTITNIPLSQFIRPHLKHTAGMYKKDGYQGCIRVSYNDVALFRELIAIKDCFVNKKGD